MFCSHCGTKVEGNPPNCPNCGENLSFENKKKSRNWISYLIGFAFLGLITSLLFFLADPDPLDPVQAQLDDFHTNDYTEAYYAYTSSDFQKATSLDTFKEFVKQNPFLKNISNIEIVTKEINGENAALTLNLTSGKVKSGEGETSNEPVAVLYQLVKIDGEWKIDSLTKLDTPALKSSDQMTNRDKAVLPFENTEKESDTTEPLDISKDDAAALIKSQLSFFKGKQVDRAYNDISTPAFKESTTLEQFQDFVATNPILSKFEKVEIINPEKHGDYYTVPVQISNKDESAILQYTLESTKGILKIRGLEILSTNLTPITSPQVTAKILDRANNFIKLISQNKIAQAYKEDTTKEFKDSSNEKTFSEVISGYESFTENASVEWSDPFIKGDVLSIRGQATSKKGKTDQIEMDFVPIGEEWKIQQILFYEDQPVARNLVIDKILISNTATPRGETINPQTIYKGLTGKIFVNLVLLDVTRGDVVEASLIPNNSDIQPVTVEHTVQDTGPRYLAFFDFEISKGEKWPPGNYKILARSKSNPKLTLDKTFIIE